MASSRTLSTVRYQGFHFLVMVYTKKTCCLMLIKIVLFQLAEISNLQNMFWLEERITLLFYVQPAFVAPSHCTVSHFQRIHFNLYVRCLFLIKVAVLNKKNGLWNESMQLGQIYVL